MLTTFFFHAIVVLGGLLLIFSRRNPFKHYAKFTPAISLALASASSASSLPTTIACAIKDGISERIASFVLPLGATINMVCVCICARR